MHYKTTFLELPSGAAQAPASLKTGQKNKAITVGLVRFLRQIYRGLVSPMIHMVFGAGAGCRFNPTCGDYFMEAVERHGPVRGSGLGLARVCRCHPWGGHGEDPVPEMTRLVTHKENK